MSLNKNNLTLYFFLMLLTGPFQLVHAQKDADTLSMQNLGEVLVTATRTKRQLSALPLPAQIITKQQIDNINSIRLSNLLAEQTGLITVPDFGGGEGLQMQGLDAQYSLILIDGVPLVGRSAGTLDLNRISVGNIKQIEVVKGASSSLYGSEAIAGVVNIITETPKQGLNGGLDFRQSSFNTSDLSVNLSHKNKKLALSGFLNRLSSNGYDLNNSSETNTVEPFQNYTLNTKIIYDFTDKTKLNASLRYFTQEQDLVASEELKGESSINEWNTLVKIDHEYNDKWASTMEFYATNYQTEEFLNENNGATFSNAFFNQYMIRPELRSTFKPNDKHTFIGGMGLTHEKLDRTSFNTTPVFNAPYVYVQWDTNLLSKTNLIVGARYDNHNAYASQFSPKAALRYELNEAIALKGSVGYGFKAPDFRQLYFDFSNSTVGYTVLGYNVVGSALTALEEQGQIANILVPASEFNGKLQAERSVNFNLGIDFDPTASLKIKLNLFRNNISNLIDTRVIANRTNGQNVFSYFNVAEVYTQGIEFNTTYKFNNYIKVSGGYQLLFAKDREAEAAFANGEVFARERPTSPAFQLSGNDYFGLFNRSRHMANLKLYYEWPEYKISSNLRIVYRSRYGIADTNGNGYLDNYDAFVEGNAIVNFALNKTLFKKYKVAFGIDNLFNFTDAANIPNVPGRIYYVNMNFKL